MQSRCRENGQSHRSDSKPCVNCGVMIHRTEKCLQMWCPHCQTAFDWRTGGCPEEYTTRIISNTGVDGTVGEHGDIPCGGAPRATSTRTPRFHSLDEELRDKRRMILHYYYARLEIERELDWEWDPNDQRDEQARNTCACGTCWVITARPCLKMNSTGARNRGASQRGTRHPTNVRRHVRGRAQYMLDPSK